MADTMVTDEDRQFGTEHSLISEMIRTGRSVGAGRRFYAALAHDPEAFRRAVAAVMGTDAPTTPAKAAAIMGSNFIRIADVERHLEVEYTPRQLRLLEVVPFSAVELRECANTHILMPGSGLTIEEMRARVPDMFLFKSSPASGTLDYRYGYKSEVTIGWRLVRKTPLPDSIDVSWERQQEMVGPAEYIPNACVVIQAGIMSALIIGERLFVESFVRTSDTSEDGVVVVGDHKAFGLDAYSRDGNAKCHTGIVTARRPLPDIR